MRLDRVGLVHVVVVVVESDVSGDAGDAIVIGGGIAGLATAALLGADGWSAELRIPLDAFAGVADHKICKRFPLLVPEAERLVLVAEAAGDPLSHLLGRRLPEDRGDATGA